tara:strand:+ start:523 stop:768 length:246 start_codon:yes stop_codon:yes gene_type:complete
MHKKVTKEMVEDWLSGIEERRGEEAIKTIIEIANSIFDKEHWTPEILHRDISQSWEVRDIEIPDEIIMEYLHDEGPDIPNA